MYEKVFVKTIKYKHEYNVIGLTFEKFHCGTAAIARVRAIFLMFNFFSYINTYSLKTHTHTCVYVYIYI